MSGLSVIKLTVGQLKENCYLLVDNKSKNCLIIDPGDEGEYISSVIERQSLKPVKIVATHGHFDHISAVTFLKLTYKVPFLINKKDAFLVDRLKETSIHFTGIDPGPKPKIDVYLKREHEIKLGKSQIEVMTTPGHTPGSISLYVPGMIFVGDVLFSEGSIGSSEFEYQSRTILDKSIDKILSLPSKTRILSGHGEETSVEKERKFHES